MEKQLMTMEILNKLSKKVFFTLTIIISFCTEIYSQDISRLKNIFVSEVDLLDAFYEDRLFFNIHNEIDTNNIIINKYEVLHNYYPETSLSLNIHLVNVSFVNLQTNHTTLLSLDGYKFDYILFSTSRSSNLMKLFGFFTTDISYLKQYNTGINSFKSIVELLSNFLIEKKIIQKKYAKKFLKAILNNEATFTKNFSYPVNILNIMFPNNHHNTFILPYEIIKPVFK